MATLVSFSGDGLTDGTQLGTGVAGTYDTTPSGQHGTLTPFTKQTWATDGKPYLRLNAPSASAAMKFTIGTAVRALGFRYYFYKPTTMPSAAYYNLTGSLSGGTAIYKGALSGSGSPGQFRLYDSAGTSHASGNLWAVDGWYRYEGYIKADPNNDGNQADGQARFLGYAGDSTTPLYDSSWQTWPVGTGVPEIWFGSTQTPPGNSTLWLRYLTVTDDPDTLIGPWVDPTPPAATEFVKTASGLKAGTDGFVKTSSGLKAVLARYQKTASGLILI